MKDLARGFIWWLIRILLVLNIILGYAIYQVCCQTPTPTPKVLHSKQHKDTIEQQDEIRFMFITVTDKKDDMILFYRNGKKLIEVSFLFYDEQTIFKTGDAKPPYTYTGCFAALICLKHSYIYWLQRQPCSEETGSFFFKDK